MYRSHPQTQSILDTIRSGAIGEVKIIKTSFCYRTTKIDGNIRFNRELAGGAMMDVGCYCLDFSRLIAGEEPNKIMAAGKLHASGVDEWAGGTLHFPGGIIASFVCGMSVQGDNSAHINGTDGYLEIGWPWKPQRMATYTIAHSTPPRQDAKAGAAARPPKQEISVEADVELYALEADDFAAAVLDGAAPKVSQAQTLGNMRALDEIRRQIGVEF
jgi:predicted dehydrogenase